MRERPRILDAMRNRGIVELARRLMNAARRVSSSEEDAEELARDGFARCCAPQRPGQRAGAIQVEGPHCAETTGASEPPSGSRISTTYSKEFEDIVARCGHSDGERSEHDEQRINSFVFRLTMTTCRHRVRTQARTVALAEKLASYQAVILESVEDDLCRWSDNEEVVTRVLDAILTELSRKRDTALGRALKDRLRNELADADQSTTNDEIAAKHGVSSSTLRSSWHHLVMTLFRRNNGC